MNSLTTTTPTEIKPLRPDLIEALRQIKVDQSLSDAELGRRTGTNSTQINRALNGKFLGDEKAFEARIEDFLKADPLRREARRQLSQNVFADQMRTFLETVRRTEDVGLAFSPAGKGKTSGIALYVADNPTAIALELNKWSGGAGGIERLIFNQIDSRGWRGNTSRGDFLVNRLRGSRRLIILDNAQRLTSGGRQFIFDFHDATDCPIALVGNPEVLDAIRQNDQQFSRIGLRTEIKGGKVEADVAHLIALHFPKAAGCVEPLAIKVAKMPGHLRALRKQLLLANEIAGSFPDPAAAFTAAHTKLVRDYRLED